MATKEKARGMDRVQFMNLFRQGKVNGAWLLEGEEDRLRTEAVQEIRRTLLPPGLEALNGVRLTAPDTDSLIAACETLPFMGDMRVVAVQEQTGLTGRAEADERLCEYVQRVPAHCLLLFLCHGASDGRKKLPKVFQKMNRLVNFSRMQEGELAGWIIAGFAELGKSCDQQTARELIFAAGNDGTRLRGEIAKLAALAGPENRITRELVLRGASPTAEYSVFQLVDAVVAGQRPQALRQMRTLLVNGESPLGILYMLLRQYRLLQRVKIMKLEKVPPQDYAANLGVSDWLVRNYLRQADALSARDVREGVRICLDMEYRVKSGQVSHVGCLETVLLQLFAARSRGQ
jgi:DNA polymerase-3 subunit delta